MPDPTARKAVPPPSPNRPKPRDILQPPAEEDNASLEPTDDLRDYLVPADPALEPPAENKIVATNIDTGTVTSAATSGGTLTPTSVPPSGSTVIASPPNTAETELVRRLQAELAAAQARLAGQQGDIRFYSAGPRVTIPNKGDKVLIHVREDGFTANGRVWYVGQELEFTVGAPNWEATLDRKGNSWTLLDDADQLRQYGKVMFGHGPWPGAAYLDEKAALAEKRRGREAPAIPQLSSLKNP